MIRRYSELKKLRSFKERFEYLKLGGEVGRETFGFERYLNQRFYSSKEWKRIRDEVIVRDVGRDLGVFGYDISGAIIIHHMNPVSAKDILHQNDILLNPEFLICTSYDTHNAIHFGDELSLTNQMAERSPNDQSPWKQQRR